MTPRAPRSDRVYPGIVAAITRRITDGDLLPGEYLPSLRQLERQYHVGAPTLCKALAVLKERGFIEQDSSDGARVAARVPGMSVALGRVIP